MLATSPNIVELRRLRHCTQVHADSCSTVPLYPRSSAVHSFPPPRYSRSQRASYPRYPPMRRPSIRSMSFDYSDTGILPLRWMVTSTYLSFHHHQTRSIPILIVAPRLPSLPSLSSHHHLDEYWKLRHVKVFRRRSLQTLPTINFLCFNFFFSGLVYNSRSE